MNDFELFQGTSFSDLMKDVYHNSKKKSRQIDSLIQDLKPFIKNIGDATIIAPLLKDYLEVSVKNDEQLIKVAAIVQKLASAEAKGSDNEFGLSELEKEQLMSGLTDTIQEIQEESDRISEEIDSKQSTFPEG